MYIILSKHHAEKNISKVQVDANPNDVLDVIDKLPDKSYSDMADVEKSVSTIL